VEGLQVNVSSLVFAPLQGGALGGLFSLELVLGGRLQVSSPSLTKQVLEIAERSFPPAYRRRVLWVQAMNAVDVDADEMDQFLAIMRDKGFVLILETDGQARPSWFNFATALVATVRQPIWLEYSVAELRYAPPVEDEWKEPLIGLNNEAKARYLIFTPSKVNPRKVLQFMAEAKHEWAIIDWSWRPVQILHKLKGDD
jgi:hypothetical protein